MLMTVLFFCVTDSKTLASCCPENYKVTIIPCNNNFIYVSIRFSIATYNWEHLKRVKNIRTMYKLFFKII